MAQAGQFHIPDVKDDNYGLIYPAQVVKGFKNDHEIIMGLKRLNLDVLKMTYEWYGLDLHPTKNKILYENDLYNNGLKLTYENTINWSSINWSAIPEAHGGKAGCDACITFFRDMLGLHDYTTAGILSCIEHESGFDSSAINVAESEGRSTGSTAEANSPGQYGAGIFQFTGPFKMDVQEMIGGYKIEAQPLSVQMQVAFAESSRYCSIVEAMQNFIPWKPDIKDIIKKRLVNLKEITPEQETGKNQYWGQGNDISELEKFACEQSSDCWSLLGEHAGGASFEVFLAERGNMVSGNFGHGIHRWLDPATHTPKRRSFAVGVYKYMKGIGPYPG